MTTLTLFATGLTTGLVAGGASCAAVQGGLLAGAVSRRRAAEPEIDPLKTAGVSVVAFLAAKLTSHALLGALLGAVGAAVQPSPRARAVLLVLAAAGMVIFALDLLGVRAVRHLVPRPPQAWTRRVRRSTRSGSVFAPAVLGFLTVLLPCGVTLSVELLAVTSGSLMAGAAVMAGFVLGTAPLFAALGFVLRQSTRIWQGRLSIATGVLVLAVAVWTLGSGLRLGGWLPTTGPPAVAADSAPPQTVQALPDGTQVVTLQVKETSYSPEAVVARPGVKTTLVLRTEKTHGCNRAFVIPSRGVQEILPETGQTKVDLGVPKAGTLEYSCAMGMYGGRIEFRETAR